MPIHFIEFLLFIKSFNQRKYSCNEVIFFLMCSIRTKNINLKHSSATNSFKIIFRQFFFGKLNGNSLSLVNLKFPHFNLYFTVNKS